ncbi:MAG: DUF3347 domain-containing protein [Bacteroidota bacterium]|nr:DUF3347 domain-containing protein [Bacteroidota bacterium]
MKKYRFAAIAIALVIFSACNSHDNKSPESKGMDNKKTDTAQQAAATNEKEVKVITAIYPQLDAGAAASIKAIVDHYLHIKNALTSDNGSEAAGGGKAMEEVIRKMDKSLFTVEQKKIYDNIAEDLQEHAEHIGKNGDNVKHQREHFAMMSDDVYDLVKAFGAGRPIYQDHCPMYNEGKGAIWLSESKEIKNPYYGNKMITCGSVEEMLR